MKAVYMKNGLKSSSISEEAIQLLLKAADKLIDKGAEIIVGACSEVPIVLNQSKLTIPFIDSIDLLARESVNQCYNLKVSKSLVDE
jgi:aspartate racemase